VTLAAIVSFYIADCFMSAFEVKVYVHKTFINDL